MNRRWFWAVRSANTSMRARVTMSIHGDSVSKGSGSSVSCRISVANYIRPRGSALRRRPDDDVATAEFKAVPAVAVVHSRLVPAHGGHPRRRLAPVTPRTWTSRRGGASRGEAARRYRGDKVEPVAASDLPFD